MSSFDRRAHLDFTDPHATSDPPPPTEPDLPQDRREQEMLQPIYPVLFDRDKIERCRNHREKERPDTEHCCAAVEAPRAPAIDEKPPDEEGCGEYEEKRRVEDVADRVAYVEDGLRAGEGGERQRG